MYQGEICTRKIWALLLCAAMLAGLSACSGKAKEEEKGAGYTVELPDGTSLKFEKVPERIVSMGPNITDILFKLFALPLHADSPASIAAHSSSAQIFLVLFMFPPCASPLPGLQKSSSHGRFPDLWIFLPSAPSRKSALCSRADAQKPVRFLQ